jgi:alpha-D-ribose 1-methylphosphonate 5-triphosphate diphosphatase
MDVHREATTETVVRGGSVLLDGQGLVSADIVIEGKNIAKVGRHSSNAGARVIEAEGAFVLPGIIDIHGDAFERNIMPRPKTMFPLEMAMTESDRQLAANGVTTAYHGVTISWEPGLRSLAQSLKVIAALEAIEDCALIDNRLHIRWENYALDEIPDVIDLFQKAKRPVLAFNDHTTSGIAGERKTSKYESSAEKAMISVEDYLNLLRNIAVRTPDVAKVTAHLAAQAKAHNIIMLSHDDSSAEMRNSYRKLGVSIAEFPMNWETAEAAAEKGDFIVLGAPNVVRGGSHNGAISAEEAIKRGLCNILASDYFYPALLQSALTLARNGTLELPAAWALISSNPAEALSLSDRGTLGQGKRADLIVLPQGASRPSLVMSAGCVVYREG